MFFPLFFDLVRRALLAKVLDAPPQVFCDNTLLLLQPDQVLELPILKRNLASKSESGLWFWVLLDLAPNLFLHLLPPRCFGVDFGWGVYLA